jgi:hypothetical protein
LIDCVLKPSAAVQTEKTFSALKVSPHFSDDEQGCLFSLNSAVDGSAYMVAGECMHSVKGMYERHKSLTGKD